jgi:hypothetical protein
LLQNIKQECDDCIKYTFVFGLTAITNALLEKHVKFCMVIDHKQNYRLHMSEILNTTVQNSLHLIKLMRICSTENCTKIGITNCIIINLQLLLASQCKLKHLKNLFHAIETSTCKKNCLKRNLNFKGSIKYIPFSKPFEDSTMSATINSY